MFRKLCAHHQEVKILLYSIWYHHTETSEWSNFRKLWSNFIPLTCFSVMIPDAVQYNFDLLMMSTQCSKHVEAYNKLIIKKRFCAISWLITKILLRCTVRKT